MEEGQIIRCKWTAKFMLTNFTETHDLFLKTDSIHAQDPVAVDSRRMTSRTIAADDPTLIEALTDNETILQVISNSRTFLEEAQLQSCEPDRSQITDYLKYLTENFWCDNYRARTWGYTIIRTAYRDGDDEKFKHGIDKIHRFLRLWSDTEVQSATKRIYGIGGLRGKYEFKYYWPERMPEIASSIPNELFLGRFVNDIVEDKEKLNEATVAQVSNTSY